MNQVKKMGKGRRITGIVFLALSVLGLLIYAMGSDFRNIETLNGSIIFFSTGIILLFVKIRGYGWLIGAAAFLSALPGTIIEDGFDSGAIGALLLVAICLVGFVATVRRKKK